MRKHPSPLHGLLHNFQINPNKVKTIDFSSVDHDWTPGFRTLCAGTRQDGIDMDAVDTAPIQIYTDGSGNDGQVGAAAVLYREGHRIRSTRFLLGSEKDYMVPTAEGLVLVLALELLKEERGVGRVTITTDNVGAIARAKEDKADTAQFLWKLFQRQWMATQKRFRIIQLVIRWVPGHEGIPGNEEADCLAKKATTHGSSRARTLPKLLHKPMPVSRSAVRRWINSQIKARVLDRWHKSM